MKATRPPSRLAALALAAAALVGLGACASKTASVGQPIAGKSIKKIDASLLPGEVAGLKVTAENLDTQLAGVKRSFVNELGLFGLRRGDLLVSTLEVSHFNSAAKVQDPKFQASVLARIGASVPKLYILSGNHVFLTSGNKQTVAVWFRKQTMLVLSVRQDYATPRSLVRQMLDLTEKSDKIS